MKSFSPKVSFLTSSTILSTKHLDIFSKAKNYSFFSSIWMRLFATILKLPEGTLLLTKTDDAQGERRMLERLKQEGCIMEYKEGPLFSDYPKMFMVSVTYSSQGMITTPFRAWGYCRLTESKTLAYSKAIGEFLERDATYYRTTSSLRVIHKDCSFLFPYLPKFTKKQHALNKKLVETIEDLSTMRSVNALSVFENTKIPIPLSSFFWGEIRTPGEKIIADETSNGGGGGLSKETSFLSALYELIERDHFLLYWFSGIAPKRIRNATIEGEFGLYVKTLEEEYGLEIYFLDISYDLPFAVCACVVIDPVLHSIALGGKASASPSQSLKSSLLEALAVMTNLREKNNFLKEEALQELLKEKSFNKNITGETRLSMYCSAYGISCVKELFLNGDIESYHEFSYGSQTFTSHKDEEAFVLASCKKLLEEKGEGYQLYRINVATPLTRRFNYYVTKVFVPAFLKLHLTESAATPVSERLFQFAKEKGGKLFDEEDINTLPHFFP